MGFWSKTKDDWENFSRNPDSRAARLYRDKQILNLGWILIIAIGLLEGLGLNLMELVSRNGIRVISIAALFIFGGAVLRYSVRKIIQDENPIAPIQATVPTAELSRQWYVLIESEQARYKGALKEWQRLVINKNNQLRKPKFFKDWTAEERTEFFAYVKECDLHIVHDASLAFAREKEMQHWRELWKASGEVTRYVTETQLEAWSQEA